MIKFSPLLLFVSLSGCYNVADAAIEDKVELGTFTKNSNQIQFEASRVPAPTIEPCYDWYLLKKEEIKKVEKEIDKDN